MTPVNPGRAAQAGFTLLEAMVALVLLALVMAPAYSLMSGGRRAAAAVDRRSTGLAIAEAQLAALGVEQTLAPGRYDGTGGGFSWTLTVVPRTDPPFDAAASRGMAAYQVSISVSDHRGEVAKLAVTRLVAAR